MGKLVLVCDDDRPILEVTRTILEYRNLKVVISVSCENIVEKVLQHKPDLILMDLWIPETGGDKATIELKNHPETKDIPVLLFSAVNNLKSIAKSCGADGYIQKPFELEELIDKVEEKLNASRPLLNDH
jgi:CheY-like chemotaxis protein